MWNKEDAIKLLEKFPKDKKKATIAKIQGEIDVHKYCASYDLGFDLCGFYAEFCDCCDKTEENPCAKAYVRMRDLKKGAEEEVAVSLSDSLKSLADAKTDGAINKKSIAKYLKETYGDKLTLNERENYIKNGHLPLADTHFVKGDKKDNCFVYVYENKQGKVLLLVKGNKKLEESLKSSHPKTRKSNFPKSNKSVWLSVPVDETFNEKSVYDLLDALIKA